MLATKYRPKTFNDVVGQEVTKRLIQNQLQSQNYENAIFVGNSGSGKTTCAKIVASMINGEIHELDCASHNGVSDIKEILEEARVPSLTKAYKVYVLDECQTLSGAAWSAMLIALEEKIPQTIFIFCTTDAQKIPNTIFSRVQRYDFRPIPNKEIINRLKVICAAENITIADDCLQLLAESAKGSMRQALTNLDKCLTYGDLGYEAVKQVLNIIGKDCFKALTEATHSHNIQNIITLVNAVYNKGYEMHQFISQYLQYCIDIGDLELLSLLLTVKNDIKYDDNPKTVIIARLLTFKE